MTAATLGLDPPNRWIRSGPWDAAFILLPMTLPAVGVLLFPSVSSQLSTWQWAVLVLGVDVTHVWSTLAVTYLKPGEFSRRPLLYTLTPVGCFLASFAAYAYSGPDLFWRLLAYIVYFIFCANNTDW